MLLVFRLHPDGFTNADLRTHLTQLLGINPDTGPAGRATYDLRRLRLHGLIERIPTTHRYRVTTPACTTPCSFLTRVHNRLIRTGTAQLADPKPAETHATACRNTRLRHRAQRPHPTSRPRRLKLDPIKTTSSSKAL